MTIEQRSKCIKYSFKGCLPSKSSGSLTGFLNFRSAVCSTQADDFARGQRSFSIRNGLPDFSRGVENALGVKFSASAHQMEGLAVFPCFCPAAGRSGAMEGVQSLPLRKGFAGFARGVSLAGSVESPTSDRTKKDPSASNSLLKGFFGLIGVSHRCHQCEDCIPGPETETLAQIRQIHIKRPCCLLQNNDNLPAREW